jgi:hypothetical protein
MGKLIRNSFSGPRVALPTGGAELSGGSEAAVGEGASRRAFIGGSVGAAAGAAVILATPKVAAIARDSSGSSVTAQPEPKPVVTTLSGPAPHEPVTAYVRDAERGEVTVMSGKNMTTYKDPALVKRLLDAAH